MNAGVERAVEAQGIVLDPAQRALLLALDRVRAAADASASPRGLYVHGPVGRGKSWLLGAWFEAHPEPRKLRVHFHAFLDRLHREVFAQRQAMPPGEGDPLEAAFARLLGESRLLFFDEFHVHDPGDARLLTRLLEYVFEREMVLIATSNYAPRELMPSPVWHHLFERGIALILERMEAFALDGPVDYRTVSARGSGGFASGLWRAQAPAQADAQDDADAGRGGAAGPTGSGAELVVQGRSFTVSHATEDELRATFAELCEAPLSIIEYLAWAERFDRWTITEVPAAGAIDVQALQRFANLVDVLVEADVRLTVLSAQALPEFVSAAAALPDAGRMRSRLSLLAG
ncbi:MAG: cell division protein ZapE [Leucobacter sp.]